MVSFHIDKFETLIIFQNIKFRFLKFVNLLSF
jgi:hypothetical protein